VVLGFFQFFFLKKHGFCFLHNPVMRSPENWLDTVCMIYNLWWFKNGYPNTQQIGTRLLVYRIDFLFGTGLYLWFETGLSEGISLLWCFTEYNLGLRLLDVTPLDKFLSHLCIDQKICNSNILLPNSSRCHTFVQSFVSLLHCSAISCFYVPIFMF
jgi:hypothetical protein